MSAGAGSLVGVYAEGESIRPGLVVGTVPTKGVLPRLNIVVLADSGGQVGPVLCANVPHIGDSDRLGAHPHVTYVMPDRRDGFVWKRLLEAKPFHAF